MTKILVVEDERIVAQDIHNRLTQLGYTVSAIASSGEEALKKAKETPDVVLMDIVLKGGMDGIEAAESIRALGIPVIYVTAYADKEILQRAKVTEPYGYILKPFEDRELHITIEMALHRHEIERKLRDSEEKYKHIVEDSIDGVGMAQNGKIIYVNDAYCKIFGYERKELIGESLLKVVAPEDVSLIRERAKKRLEGEKVPNNYVFKGMKKDGTKLFIEVSTSKPFVYRGTPTILAILRDVTERKKAEMQLKILFEASRLMNATMDIDETFAYISDSVQKLIGFDNFVIFLGSKDKNNIYPAYTSGKIKEMQKVKYGEGVVGSCIATKETALIEDAQEDTIAVGMKSHVVVPLVVEGDCVGAFCISKTEPQSYTCQDIDVLNLLSEVGSSALRNAWLHKEIKEFGEELEKRIKEKSEKIEILLNTRQELQKERSWENGLETIVESMEKLGFERVGIFLVNPMKRTLDSHSVKGASIPKRKISISLKSTEYFGVKCVLEKRTIHVKAFNPAEGKQMISDSQSFVWVPIVVQNEACAVLAADNVKSSTPLTEEDVKDLEILAGMCAAFIDRTRIHIEPVAENRLKTAFKYWLDPLEVYLVLEKKPERSFEMFVDLVTHGIPGFAVTRMYPEKMKRKYKLVKTPMLWLSRTGGETTVNPDDLSKLQYIIEDFTRKSAESVILLDGLEYLITQTGFETVLMYLQGLKDTVVLNNTRLIIPLHKETLSEREFSALEREFSILEPG